MDIIACLQTDYIAIVHRTLANSTSNTHTVIFIVTLLHV